MLPEMFMTARPARAVFLVLFSLGMASWFAPACGGSTTVGSSDGGSGLDGGGDGAACTINAVPGNRACVPGTARANAPIEIAVLATEGCLGCFTTFEPCKVEVNDKLITVTMVSKTCPPPGDQACPAVCMLPRTTCTLPALSEGTYTVRVTGEGADSASPKRELVVAADGGVASCTLPSPPNPPDPMEGSKYSKSCAADADCEVVSVGSLCTCACPNFAIAKSSLSDYESDKRAHLSQCEPASPVACGPCQSKVAKCDRADDGGGVSGTCVLTAAQ